MGRSVSSSRNRTTDLLNLHKLNSDCGVRCGPLWEHRTQKMMNWTKTRRNCVLNGTGVSVQFPLRPFSANSVCVKVKRAGDQLKPGEVSLQLELLLHFAANLAGSVVDFADFGEEGGNLVAPEKTSCSSLQQVTQAGLDGSWWEGRRTWDESVIFDQRREHAKRNRHLLDNVQYDT